MKKELRCYLIGFNQPWSQENQDLCRRLIEGADFCATAPEGIPVGSTFRTIVLQKGKDEVPTEVRCIRHEHGGKVIIVLPI